MSRDDLFKVGARLLGLYFLTNGVASIPAVVGAYEAALSSKMEHPSVYVASAGFQALALIVASIALLLRNRLKLQSADERKPNGDALLVGIQLLALYFAVSGGIWLVRGTASTLMSEASWIFRVSDIVPAAIETLVGVVMGLRASAVAKFLEPTRGGA